MMEKLKDMVSGTFDYSVGKIYDGIYNQYPLVKMNFTSVKENYELIKSEIDRRYGLPNRQGIADLTRRMDYILSKVEAWITSDNLLKNNDAEVFMDAFVAHFKDFEVMLLEMDSE